MPLPEPYLDDLRFQRDLVDEARRRIIRYCPEWTDYNLSDPGITLIELFAWMTELIVYRLNLVPDKNHIKFLDLLGIRLRPASSARTELTFFLSAPFPINAEDEINAVVPKGTEVATRRTEQDEEVIFTTDERLLITSPRLVQIRREDDVNKNYLPRMGVEIFYVFNRRRPQFGDTFYLGFEETFDLSGYILQLHVTAERTQAPGVKREDPPLVWECSMGNGVWEEVPMSRRPGEKDTTGGLNNEDGNLVLYLPLGMQPDEVHGRLCYWVRCRHEQRRKEQGMYSESPRVKSITAYALGASARATHAVIVENAVLGTSTGEAGQIFRLEHTPVLSLHVGETIEVEEKQYGEMVFVPWTKVNDFSESDSHDRHYTLDEATGEIQFGPNIRQPDGSMRQYGRVPETGRALRFSRYRYGGGVVGNVPAGKLQVLKSTVPYVDRVMNLQRASGGQDPETLDEAKMRARREMRAQQRAVTAEDYENLGLQASRGVARIKCNTPGSNGANGLPPGMIELLVVPAVADSLRHGDLSKLQIDAPLRQELTSHLNQFRLLTSTLQVREPRYIGIKAQVQIEPAPWSAPETIRVRALEALRSYLSPLPLGDSSQIPFNPEEWQGWPFGGDLYITDLYTMLQKIPGVKHIRDIQLSLREVKPATENLWQLQEEGSEPGEGGEGTAQTDKPLTPVMGRVVELDPDSLICSLDHEVIIAEV